MIGEVVGEQPRLLEEHAHVLQLYELRFGHRRFLWPTPPNFFHSPFLTDVQFTLRYREANHT